MKFYEKLDFLMNITKTTNSSLAMHISLDPSHISRLRRGERRLVPDAEYLIKMSAYFIKQSLEEYQKIVLAERIKVPKEVFDFPDKATEEVYNWLLLESNSETDSVDSFLDEINKVKKDGLFFNYVDTRQGDKIETDKDVSLYYGLQGKREAVLRFLSIVLDKEEPGELLLYSDEPMDWLTEDVAFQLKWAEQLYRVIS
ncbi:MAG: hypothetical protein GX046_08860 [Tissierellia bacterium]|nr:hypothetical protein [Tissierellia bacterium]